MENDETRYEIECVRGGDIIEAPGIRKVVASRGLSKPVVIVYVGASDKHAFEKVVEGNANVLSYRATPATAAGGREEVYERANKR